MTAPQVQVAAFDELGPRLLYEILRLRARVFVVEQSCVYCDLDDRDHESGARHLWIADDGRMVAYARLLREPDGGARIGRFVTEPAHRGRGLAARLMDEALRLGEAPFDLWAQAHLADWYAGFGFEVCGPVEVAAGIPHVPMRREAPYTAPAAT
jgi:ElaA protein